MDKSKYTAKGKHGVAPGDVIAEDDRREAAVPAPPPSRPNLADILQEVRRPSSTTRPPPRKQAQDPVTRNVTDEEANGHSSVSLCRGNHQRLVCHWSLRDSKNTNQTWRVNLVDYIDNEEARRQNQGCLERRPAELRQMLARRVYDDLLDRFDEQVRRRGAAGITPPVFQRTQEELTPLVNRRLNSLSSTGRSIDTVPASRSTAPPRSTRDAQEEEKGQKQKIEAWENKMKREKEELDKVNANRAKREEARKIANEAKRKEEEARRIADEAALENSATESTRSLSYSLSPAARTPVKTAKKTAQDSKKSATKSAGGETTVRTRAKAARPIVESDTSSDSSDYSDSVKPPQPSKEDLKAAKLIEEPPATLAKKTPAKSTEKAPAKSTEKAPAKSTEKAPAESTEKTPAKPTEEAPAKPTTSEEPTTSAKSTETAPAKPDPKASGTTKKLSLAEFTARRKAAKAAAEASTATATADAEAEATVDTTAETEVKETATTMQNSPGGEIIERHETHVTSTETRTHSTPPPPLTEHQSKDTADVEVPSSQPPSPGSPGKRKRSAAEEEPLPDSDARTQRILAPSPEEDDPSPRKKSETVTPPESPPPPPSAPPPSPSYWTSKKRKMVLAEEEGEVTITSSGGTRAKRARSDDGKDGEASKTSAPAEEKSVDTEAEEPADADIEALFHGDSQEDGSPGLSVLTAGDEASSSPAQTGEDPAGTEKSENDRNEADGEASDS